MNAPDERLLEMPFFRRSTAGADLREKLLGCDVWSCEGPEFRHQYDKTVTLFVQHGRAVVHFADGTEADLQPGDTMTIIQGASAVWAISTPIRNSYVYHDAA